MHQQPSRARQFISVLLAIAALLTLAIFWPGAAAAQETAASIAATANSDTGPNSETAPGSETAASPQPSTIGSTGASLAIVVGAPGADEFESQFEAWADRWMEAGQRSGGTVVRLDAPSESTAEPGDEPADDFTRLKNFLESQASGEGAAASQPLWLVFIGHGTFNGDVAKFNLKGPDVSADELAQWLQPVTRPVVLIDCTSSSSPFIHSVSGPNRVIVTGTRDGYEMNYARFGDYFSSAIGDPQADLDKDQQTSVLEAFLKASADVAEFYDSESRLATEHALLDDNGDGLGTPYDWFRGVRAIKKPAGGATIDGTMAHQIHLIASPEERRMPPELRAYRDQLERDIIALRESKANLDEDAYYAQFEVLAVALANVYRWQDAPTSAPPEPLPIDPALVPQPSGVR